ncbi:MAG: hypothetical protein M3439_01280 [Chloroflexota bacterium]|nr:hypothetical protein [Chloroflexota bacterium]
MIVTLDSSFVFAALISVDINYRRARPILETESGLFVVPVMILAELDYTVESRLGRSSLNPLLEDLQFHRFVPD